MAATAQCPICLEEMKASIGMLGGCKHIFCYDCIKKWSEVKQTCPLDRSPFDSIKILHEIGGAVVEEEKLEPRGLDQIHSSFNVEGIDDFVSHFSVSRMLFESGLTARVSDQHYRCFGCRIIIAEEQMFRSQRYDLANREGSQIEVNYGVPHYICPRCRNRERRID
ncbi:unnamed protein product [Rodentolepis nana]|uniref:RING-type domain-containing protein n=1 Tax=Rodentolepis nana TaxID=102285 RepID=A0A0R3T9F6_RODNA|nr:unnamed protein product [Rodentolepis nana]